MVCGQTMFFSTIELKLLFYFSRILNNQMTNNLYVCDSVNLSLSDRFECVIIYLF